MKTQIRLAFAALLLAAMAMLPAFAQEAPTLTFTGNVQICSSAAAGATCKPATPGQELPVGSHMMVGPGATAQLTYANGAIVNFTEAGLYTVNAAPASLAGTSNVGSVMSTNVGFITFAGLIAAAGVASSVLDDDENLLVPLSE